MMANRKPATQAVRLLAALMLMLAASSSAWPQAHTRQFGDYTLRVSTAGTQNLSPETAREHGIERSPRRAVLNVTVLTKEAGVDKTVPAKVQAYVRNLSGHRRDIDMRETLAGGRVSYMGTYDFVHGEVLDFTITAQPEGSSETMSMSYRDRMWAGGDLPDVPARR